MATIATKTEAKAHLRISGTSDDDLLDMYVSAAIALIMQGADEDIETNWDEYSSFEQNAANLLILQVVGDMYENREATSPLTLNTNRKTQALLNLFRYRDDS